MSVGAALSACNVKSWPTPFGSSRERFRSVVWTGSNLSGTRTPCAASIRSTCSSVATLAPPATSVPFASSRRSVSNGRSLLDRSWLACGVAPRHATGNAYDAANAPHSSPVDFGQDWCEGVCTRRPVEACSGTTVAARHGMAEGVGAVAEGPTSLLTTTGGSTVPADQEPKTFRVVRQDAPAHEPKTFRVVRKGDTADPWTRQHPRPEE